MISSEVNRELLKDALVKDAQTMRDIGGIEKGEHLTGEAVFC
jgi:hypothetical protein